MLDADANVVPQKIIVKLSCRPDEVQFSLLKLMKEYCQTLNPGDSATGSPSQGNGSRSSEGSSTETSPKSVAGQGAIVVAPARRALNRPSSSNPSQPQRQVIYTDLPSSSSSEKNSTQPRSSDNTKSNPSTTTGAAAVAPQSSGATTSSRVVFGGCGTPEQCDAYMIEAAKPKYGWQSPRPFMNAPINKMDFMTSEDGHKYELPTGACGPDNQGELVAIDYGTETVVAACMGAPGTKAEDIMAKIKSADVSKLPKVVAVKKELYAWQCLIKPSALAKDEMRICNGPGICEKVKLGDVFSGGPGCGSLKCVRFDGGGLATDKPKTKVKGPCDE